MIVLNKVLLMLHFLGLTMGLSVPFAAIAMAVTMSRSSAAEHAVLGRFMPVMSHIGRMGLAILWVTGVAMVFTRWRGFASLPWTFQVKLTAVVLLTIVVGYITWLEGRIRKGDPTAAARIEKAGKVSMLLGLIVVVFAVLTFN